MIEEALLEDVSLRLTSSEAERIEREQAVSGRREMRSARKGRVKSMVSIRMESRSV